MRERDIMDMCVVLAKAIIQSVVYVTVRLPPLSWNKLDY
jgi:hypothetical protein